MRKNLLITVGFALALVPSLAFAAVTARTIVNPASNSPLNSAVMRNELQLLENEITNIANGIGWTNANTAGGTALLPPANGGTGVTNTPSYGQLLVGNAGGTYNLTATSSLGITAAATWGSITGTLSNQTDLQNALNAKVGLTSFSAGYPLSYNSSTGAFSIVATSSYGCTVSCFASHAVSQWTNDAGYLTSLSGAASSTLLGDNNTFGGADTFSQTITGSVTGNAGTATKLATARAINGVNFDGSGPITIQAASSTLLSSDNNTFSGNTTFVASTTFQKQINAQGASTTLLSATTGWIGTLNLTNPLSVANGGTGLTSTSQNFSFMGPTSGSGAPSFRAIVAADIPTLNQNTSGSAGSVVNALTINNGGGGVASGGTYNGSAATTISYNSIGAVPTGTTITVAGTANQITSSAGAQDLSTNRTWTLSLPNLVLIPLDASSTQFSIFNKAYFGGTSTTTIDSSGNIVIPSGASLTNTGVSNGCASWSSGVLTTLGVACGTSSGGITALGNYATTTGTAISISTSTETTNGVTLGVIAAVSNNAILFTPTISGTLANAGLANSTISGVALGGTLGALSHGSTLTGTSYTGTSAVSNWDIDLTHANSWTGLQNFTGGASSSVFSINVGPLYVGGTTATTTISANATSTFATGVNLSTGCLTYNGSACLGSAGTFVGGTSLAVQLATTGALPANTYSTGVLTEVGTGALTVDGTSASVGNRVLVKNEAAQTNNGIYSVTAAGSGIAAYVLTRVSDYNSSANVYPGEATYVIGGSTLADDWWALTTVAPITVGGGGSGSNLTYVETNAASTGVVSVSCPGGFLVCSGTNPASFTIGTLPVANGGTNLTSIGASSTVLTTNGTAASWQQINLGAAVYGLLPLSNGGTNSSLTGASGLVAMNSGNTALSIPSTSYTLSSTLLTAPNASTTNLTVGTSLQIPSAANPEPTVKAYCSQSTNSPYQIQCGNNAGGTSIYDDRTGITFGLASSTVFVGTTTIGVQNVLTGFTATNISCTLQPAGATGEIEWYYANPSAYVSSTPFYFAASSTPGIYAISSNNTPATQATSTLLLGNPSNVTSVSCSPYGPISGI